MINSIINDVKGFVLCDGRCMIDGHEGHRPYCCSFISRCVFFFFTKQVNVGGLKLLNIAEQWQSICMMLLHIVCPVCCSLAGCNNATYYLTHFRRLFHGDIIGKRVNMVQRQCVKSALTVQGNGVSMFSLCSECFSRV